MVLSVEIVASEIIDWWDDERARVTLECRSTAQSISDRLEADIAALSKKDLISPRSEAYDHIKAQVQSDLEMLSRRLNRSIEQNAVSSVRKVEHTLKDEGIDLWDSLPFVATGAAAVGAVGLTAAAVSFGTATATILVFIPVTTISWPIVSVLGAGAITLSYFSPHLLERSTQMLRKKYSKSFQGQVNEAIFGPSKDGGAICPRYLAQLDAICDLRMETLS